MSDVEMQNARYQQLKMAQNCSFELADQETECYFEQERPSTGLGTIINKLDAVTMDFDKNHKRD